MVSGLMLSSRSHVEQQDFKELMELVLDLAAIVAGRIVKCWQRAARTGGEKPSPIQPILCH